MAVAIGGFYGKFFSMYEGLKDSRTWNTTNYDYAVMRNKGEFSENAVDETSETSLFVAANKYGYYDANGAFQKKLDEPVYQIRNRDGTINNNYYVDQETGDVYFRPSFTNDITSVANNSITVPFGRISGSAGAGTSSININAADISRFKVGDQVTVVNSAGTQSQIVEITSVAGNTITFANNSLNFTTGLGRVYLGPIDDQTPVYFGTSFNLDQKPTPESFTNGGNFLNFVHNMDWAEIEVNGVKIAENTLNTGNAIATDSLRMLFHYSNSFSTDAFDFTAELSDDGWVSAINPWPGMDAPYGGVPMTESFWYPDKTDNDYDPGGPDDIGIPDVLARNVFTLDSVPSTPILVDVGGNRVYELFVNGTRVDTQTLNGTMGIDIQPYLRAGKNVLGIHCTDNNGPEGILFDMSDPASITNLGLDLSASAGGWETTIGYYTTTQTTSPTLIGPFTSTAFQDLNWSYDEITGSYSAPAGPNEYVAYFNKRTADNFIMETDVTMESFLNPDNSITFQIRSTTPSDGVDTSGYSIKCYEDGRVELYKAKEGLLQTNADRSVANKAFATATPTRNIQIHANGNNIQVFIDGSALAAIDYTDENIPYEDGYILFRNQGNGTKIDNFELSSYNEPVQLLSRALREGQNSIVVKGYGSIPGSINVSGQIENITIDTSTNSVAPNLASVDLAHNNYRDPAFKLNTDRTYWSVSTKSALGIAGRLDFVNREGGAIQRVKDQFSRVNSVMENLTAILGADIDLFNSHLNVIR